MSEPYTGILAEDDGPVLRLTINRPDRGNMFRRETALELADALRRFRDRRELRVAVLTGAGDRFFCIGGEHDDFETYDHSSVMPIVDVYELLDSVPKPVVAAVNGFAVGGGQVLQLMCDLAIASDRAMFRQVGPSVGSFDAGYGTWYLEQTLGRRRAKELWYLNRKYTAAEALALGLVNEVVPAEELAARVDEVVGELLQRGPQALAGLKAAFSGRHTGVVGQARTSHDLLLTYYLHTDEAKELSHSFKEKRPPDQEQFWR
jgi:naphthoate synthase